MQIIFIYMEIHEEVRKWQPWQSKTRNSWQPRHPMAVGTCELAEVRCVWWFKVKFMSHAA